MTTLTPEVLWAQRSNEHEHEKNLVYLTINASDIDPATLKFEIEPTKVSFSGSKKDGQKYAVEIELHAEVDPAESKKHVSSRGVEAILQKKEDKAEFWPRLLKDKRKVHWLKTDFDKWVDEDEQEEEEAPNPMAGAAGGFGANDPMSQFDFSKFSGGDMGGMGGMPGMGEGDDEDDDEMPDLEEADKPAEKKTEA